MALGGSIMSDSQNGNLMTDFLFYVKRAQYKR